MDSSLTGSLRETLALFEEPGVPRTTVEVAERLDLGRRSTYDRLDRLVERDRLETKKVGAKGRVWWRPATGADAAAGPGREAAGPLVEEALEDVNVGVFVLDEDFEVVWVNGATERFFGVDREAVVGEDKRTLVDERIAPVVEDGEAFRETVLGTYDDNTYAERFECHVVPGEGRAARRLEHRSRPIESGAYAGGRIELYYDVTEQTRLKRAHEETRQELDSLVDAVEEYAIFTLDAGGHVRTWNTGAERIKGYAAEEIRGEHFSTFYTEEDRAAGVPEENLAEAAREGSVEDEGWRLREDGSTFWADVTISPVRDDEGELEGYVKVTRDMTERKHTERERELLYETTRAIAEADTVERGLEITLESVCEVTDWQYAEAWLPSEDGTLGRAEADYADEAFASFASFSEDVTFAPDEGLPGRVWASGEIEWARDLPSGSTEEYPRLEEALDAGLASSLGVPILADGDAVAVLVFLMPEYREDDERLVETITSVASELGVLVTRRRLEERIERERDLVDRLLDTSPVGIMVLDDEGEYTRINDRAMEVLGIPEGEADSYTPADRTVYDAEGNRVAPDEHPASQALATGEPVYDQELKVEFEDGNHRWLSVNAAPVLDGDGAVERVITTGQDVTRIKEQARRLEREHQALKAEISDVFDRISDGFFGLDSELRVTFVNDRAVELLEEGKAFLIGNDVREALRLTDAFEAALREALDSQEPVSVEEYYPPLEGWFENRIYPSETGLSVYFRDVTDRKERERELEESRRRYRTLIENFPNGAVSLVDEDLHYTAFGGTPLGAVDATPEELRGACLHDALPPEAADTLVPQYEAAFDGETVTSEVEMDGRSYLIRTLPVRDDDGDVFAAMGMSQDITDRKRRERELEEYERIVETVNDGVYVLDAAGRFRRVNDSFVSMTRFDRDTLLGSHASTVFGAKFDGLDAEAREQFGSGERDVAAFEEEIYTAEDDPITVESRFSRFEVDGMEGRVGVVRDITYRKKRERERATRLRQQEVVADLGQRALEENDIDALLADATELVADTLDNDYCKVLELNSDAEELLLRAGVGWDEGLVGSATVSAVEADSQAAYTLTTEEPVVVTDLDSENRFGGPDLLRNHDVRSGISVIIGTSDEPWGILGTHDTSRANYSEHDANFVRAVANVLSTAIERTLYEAELERQHQRLAALNNLNEVVRDTSSAVIEQSTREEIEETVCERLADSPPYLFAWTGEVDPDTREVRPRAEAGTDGYLDGVTITVDPDDERSGGPTGRALRTGEVAVSHDVRAEAQHDPWRERVEEHGIRSSAAIPIVHEGTVYGVLNVYAERPGAFSGEEREAVASLGEIVGHAIAATERKRALMSDELVELEFRARNVFDALDAPVEPSGTVTLDRAVPVDDGTFLVYGTATPDAVDVVNGLVEALPTWESVTVRSDGEGVADTASFEVRLVDPPVLSTVASVGGDVERMVIEDGRMRMTIHLAPGADVRRVIDTVERTYPDADLLRRQQVTRSSEDHPAVRRHLLTELTDRQRTTLEVAHNSGFFAWPREVTGEDVAASLDVSPPTFHQHLRAAERRVFEALFSTDVESAA
jgi:PAS domain S-box-containing protein